MELLTHLFFLMEEGVLKMDSKKLLKFGILGVCYLVIGLSLWVTITYLFFDCTFLGFAFSAGYPAVGPVVLFLSVISALIIIRFQFTRKWKLALIFVGISGFLLFSACIPYMALPYRIAEAESQMIATYGQDYLSLSTANMRTMPYSLQDAFYGMSIDDSLYSVQSGILYRDNGLDQFHFDYYKPTWGSGPYPVIINLHGGAWVLGGPGFENVIPFSKYMASRGYVVFDLEYGVYDISNISREIGGGELGTLLQSVTGIFTPYYNHSYTIDEQVANIGYFTKFLAQYNATYEADLNNVFVMGRSAGGHMTSVVTCGYKNAQFAGVFSSNITIRGGLWIYPACLAASI